MRANKEQFIIAAALPESPAEPGMITELVFVDGKWIVIEHPDDGDGPVFDPED
ncbi:MAG TPA: hypothetical protein VMR02_14140 [Terracidiphilus sp.]|nr:hypothetical protein [Terracidiphilus sp.]